VERFAIQVLSPCLSSEGLLRERIKEGLAAEKGAAASNSLKKNENVGILFRPFYGCPVCVAGYRNPWLFPLPHCAYWKGPPSELEWNALGRKVAVAGEPALERLTVHKRALRVSLTKFPERPPLIAKLPPGT